MMTSKRLLLIKLIKVSGMRYYYYYYLIYIASISRIESEALASRCVDRIPDKMLLEKCHQTKCHG